MMERNLTIKSFKEDTKRDGSKFYKVFFEEKKILIKNKENNVDEVKDKVHFVWSDTQAFHMLNEKQINVGMKVMCEIQDDHGYLNIKSIELNQPREKTEG